MCRCCALRYPVIGLLFALLVLASTFGCGDSGHKQKLDVAEKSVATALEAWTRGELPASLQTASPPIEFHDDDWNLGAKLVEHRITKTYIDTDGEPRCAVELKVQHRGKEPADVRATYQVLTEPKIVVGRDPMS